MTNPRYDSLRTRLVWPFVLLGYVVSVLFGLVSFALVSELEERAIDRALQVEMESFRNRLQRNPEAALPSASLLQGYRLPSPDLPGLRPLPGGVEQIERLSFGDHEYAILTVEVAGVPYALRYDRDYVHAARARLALFLALGVAVLTLLSYLAGEWLARRLVRPISRLLEDITRRAQTADPGSGPPLVFDGGEYPGDEIGQLVRAIDGYSRRLYGFLERESYFASDVSHELRTPVAVIRGAAEILEAHPGLPPAARARLATIHRQAVRMGEALEAMLILAREDEGAEDPACALAEVVEDLAADCALALEGRPVRLHTEILERPILPAERPLACAVVGNLLRNACAYTRTGEIRIRLDGTLLEIADTGIGIPEDRFPSLFQRHAKGAESRGCGLGLSIVARVARRLDWQVDIESQSGAGTRVRVRFPAAPPG